MYFFEFLPHYALWHYGRGTSELVANISTSLKFILRFFSISNLLKTLFSPWERMGEKYKKGIEFEAWAETLVANILMRLVGALIRIMTIILGLFTFAIVLVICLAVLLIWILMPLIIGGLIFLAFKSIV
jgi:hypothetical protein